MRRPWRMLIATLCVGCTAAPRSADRPRFGAPPAPVHGAGRGAPSPVPQPAEEGGVRRGSAPAPAEPAPGESVRVAAEHRSGDRSKKRDAAAEDVRSAGLEPVGSPHASGPAVSRSRPAGSPGVRASFADDNREFGSYLAYLEKFSHAIPLRLDPSGRIVIICTAGQGKPASSAELTFRDADGGVLARRTAYADGKAAWYPSEDARFGKTGVTVEAVWRGEKRRLTLDVQGRRSVEIRFDGDSKPASRVPVDVCFVLDTTGSMGDEIQRLKDTLDAVHAGLTGLPERPDLRFGMVLYRDRGDEYVTRKVPFTSDEQAFGAALAPVRSGGGGDTPEDLQEAMRVSLQELDWRDGAVKVVFVLTDAATHVYPDQRFTYLEAARSAAAKGIKLVGIGASGLDQPGEAVLRQMAQYTRGQFVFLTYGETGESDGGTPTSVSHHTGSNFQTRNLDAIIVRFVRSELAALSGAELAGDDWMEAAAPDAGGEDRDAVLLKLFDEGVRRLIDFSMLPLVARTPLAVLPTQAPDGRKAAAEKIEQQLLLAVARHPAFMLVERTDLRQVLHEQAIGLTGVVSEADAAKIGRLLGAKALVLSRLSTAGGRDEILLKLVRTETGEVLAVSLLKSDLELLR